MKKPPQADDITTEISNLVTSANRAGTLQGRNAKDHVIYFSNEAWHELREATGATGFLANVCVFGLTFPVQQSQHLPPGVRMSIQIRKPYGPGPGMVCIRSNPDHTFTVICDHWSPIFLKDAKPINGRVPRPVHLLVLNAVIK